MKKLLYLCTCILIILSTTANLVFAEGNTTGFSDDIYFIVKANMLLNQDTYFNYMLNNSNSSSDNCYFMQAQFIDEDMDDDPILQASIATYNAMTWAPSEIQQNKKYYDEMLIMDILTKDMSMSTVSKASYDYDAVYSDLNETFKKQWGLLSNEDVGILPTVEEVKALSEDTRNGFLKKILDSYEYMDGIVDYMSTLLDTCDDIESLIDVLSKVQTINQMNDNMNTVLKEMASNTSDSYMKAALNDVASVYSDTNSRVFTYVMSNMGMAVEGLVLDYVDDAYDEFLKSTPLRGLVYIRDLSTYVADKFFSTDELASYYKNSERIALFEKLLISTAKSKAASFKNGYTSFSDYAHNGEFICLIRELFYKTAIYDYEFGKKFAQSVSDAKISIFYGSVNNYISSANSLINSYKSIYNYYNKADSIYTYAEDNPISFKSLSLTTGDNIKGIKLNVVNDLTINGDVLFTDSVTVGGDVIQYSGTLNINGDMTVGGDYTMSSSSRSDKYIYINPGSTLYVKGNFYHYTYSYNYYSNVYVNGSLIIDGYYSTSSSDLSSANLYMNSDSSNMEVKGYFKYYPSDKSANFTKGKIKVGGTYYNNSTLNGTILLISNLSTEPIDIYDPSVSLKGFMGEAEGYYDGSDFIVDFGNGDISFTSLSGKANCIFNNIASLTAEKISLNSNLELNCENMIINGNVAVGSSGNVVYEGHYEVNGDYTLSSGGVSTVNAGSELIVSGNFTQTGSSSSSGSELYVLGNININGNYSGDSYSKIVMQFRDALMEVIGDFTYNGSGSYFTKGTLNVGGNFSSKNTIRATVYQDLKEVTYTISKDDPEEIISCVNNANFGTSVNVDINADDDVLYYIYICNESGKILNKAIGRNLVFNMPAQNIVVSAEYVGYRTGDVNMDGSISNIDAVILLRHISNIVLIEDELELALSDINNDGIVDMKDVVAILNYENA